MESDKPLEPAGPSPRRINTLMEIASRKTAGSQQYSLNLNIERQAEVNGLEMGVLSDGTPFLTGRGLASLCGVHHSVIQSLTADWTEGIPKARVSTIRDILATRGLSFEKPYVATWQKGNATFFAYPDAICLVVLEYYAFESAGRNKDVALKNFRALAGQALREFIYTNLGYDPFTRVSPLWRQFHDRVSRVYDAVPVGYFGIFKEIADMIVTLGQAGIPIDESFVPDISVGQHWSRHWIASEYDRHYGVRIKFDHNYPDYFPQALSNPQEAWCYPDSALGEFRRWFREAYVGQGKFERYLLQKVEQKRLPVSFAQLAIAAYAPNQDERT